MLPYVPIARQLASRGHDVTFVCPVDFEETFASEPFRVIGSELLPGPTILDGHAAFIARWGTRFGGLFLPRLYFDRIVVPRLDELYEEADSMCATADLVVSHPWSHLIVGPAAEHRMVRTVVGDLFPMLVRSRSLAPPGQRDLGRTANHAAWSMLHAPLVNRMWFMGAFRRLRQRIGLSVEGWSLFGARLSSTLNLGLFSPHYQPRLPDWPANYRVIGFCPWAPDHPALPPDVERYLDAGEPPVLVTLGSNAAAAHPDVFVSAAELLTKRRVRGVFLTSNADVNNYVRERIDPVHEVWPFLPLEPLLDRSRAVVHAGGLGTVASTLHAGLPAAIRPAVTDQIWHAQRCEALGVGVQARRHLADALSRLLDDEDLSTNARELASRLHPENGPAVAAEHIEQLLST